MIRRRAKRVALSRQERLEAGIFPQRIEIAVVLQPFLLGKAELDSPFQAVNRFGIEPQAGVRAGDVIERKRAASDSAPLRLRFSALCTVQTTLAEVKGNTCWREFSGRCAIQASTSSIFD